MYLSATFITIASLFFSVEATPPPLSRSGFAIPISRRTQIHDANGVVDIASLERNIHHRSVKFRHGFRAYQKNTGSSHPSAPKVMRSEERSIGSDPLVDLEWYGSISVGTPANTNLTVMFDMGSSDLFLPSSICDSSCDGHILYDPSTSSTAHNLGKPFYIGYSDGSGVNGTQYTDDVTIAGYTAKKQTFGVATHYSDGYKFPGWRPDGLLGLGFPSLSIYRATPVLHSLVAQSDLPTNSFGLCSSELYIGGTNDKLHKGDFTYVPVTHESYWQTNIDVMYLNGQKIAGTTSAIIDSGTAMIYGGTKAVQAFYGQIPNSFLIGSGYYSIPCSFNSEILFQFGAANVTLQTHIFNLGTFDAAKPDACVGGIAANDQFSFWVLGDVFLKNVYGEFDVGNKRIGFATLA